MAQDRHGYIYILKGGDYYKIGLSKNVDQRITQISPAMPFEVEIIHIILAEDMYKAEKYLHRIFAEKRANGEWFRLDTSDVELLQQVYKIRLNENGASSAQTYEQFLGLRFLDIITKISHHKSEFLELELAAVKLAKEIAESDICIVNRYELADTFYYNELQYLINETATIFDILLGLGNNKATGRKTTW